MKHLIVCFAALLLLGSCTKEDLESILPPETTTGANTAGFIVDGKTVVVPKYGYSSVPGGGGSSGLSLITGPNFSSLTGSKYFSIEIANYGDKQVFSADIRVHETPHEPKKYDFGQHTGIYGGGGPNYTQMVVITKEGGETQWYYSAPNSGHITFTRADTIQRIYSGVFEATLYNRFDDTKTMTISQGRFDLGPR